MAKSLINLATNHIPISLKGMQTEMDLLLRNNFIVIYQKRITWRLLFDSVHLQFCVLAPMIKGILVVHLIVSVLITSCLIYWFSI